MQRRDDLGFLVRLLVVQARCNARTFAHRAFIRALDLCVKLGRWLPAEFSHDAFARALCLGPEPGEARFRRLRAQRRREFMRRRCS